MTDDHAPATTANSRRTPRTLLIGFGITALVIVVGWKWMSIDATPKSPPSGPSTARTPVTTETVKALCSQCHVFPEPTILPKSEWANRIGQMAKFRGYGNKVRGIVNTQEVIKWYEQRAPAELDRPPLDDRVSHSPLQFQVHKLGWESQTDDPLVISNVQVAQLVGNQPGNLAPQVIACDMANGLILLSVPSDNGPPRLRKIAQIGHPARCQVVDLDRDGLRDLLVADLGSFGAIDHDLGKVTWLRQSPAATFTPTDLAVGLSRIADARAADFDADGDFDLLVGEFGWRTTGRLLLLEHTGRPGPPQAASYRVKQLDQRHGTIHCPAFDLNNDGHLDALPLFAQEHESVVAFLGDGKLGFSSTTLFQAPHPCWGSSGIQWIDLDQDGDLDALVTNGDTMDDTLLKPDHGIRWLENTADLHFTPHHIARLYGVHRAEAADIDNDGDLDIIACGFVGELKGIPRNELLKTLQVPSLIWLEQTAPAHFESRTLEAHLCDHPTLALGDIDGDGDIDIVVGNNTRSPSSDPVHIWINTTGTAP